MGGGPQIALDQYTKSTIMGPDCKVHRCKVILDVMSVLGWSQSDFPILCYNSDVRSARLHLYGKLPLAKTWTLKAGPSVFTSQDLIHFPTFMNHSEVHLEQSLSSPPLLPLVLYSFAITSFYCSSTPKGTEDNQSLAYPLHTMHNFVASHTLSWRQSLRGGMRSKK